METIDFRTGIVWALLAIALVTMPILSLFDDKAYYTPMDVEQSGSVDAASAELNIDNMYYAIVDAGIKHPDIVLAQAVLETGWFTSEVCYSNNNCFGLMYKGKYFSFDHWSESVIAYRDKLQYKMHENEDYFVFLKRIGYAEDKDYIAKVMRVRDTLYIKYPYLFAPY